jgi:hypothetical protein
MIIMIKYAYEKHRRKIGLAYLHVAVNFMDSVWWGKYDDYYFSVNRNS